MSRPCAGDSAVPWLPALPDPGCAAGLGEAGQRLQDSALGCGRYSLSSAFLWPLSTRAPSWVLSISSSMVVGSSVLTPPGQLLSDWWVYVLVETHSEATPGVWG